MNHKHKVGDKFISLVTTDFFYYGALYAVRELYEYQSYHFPHVYSLQSVEDGRNWAFSEKSLKFMLPYDSLSDQEKFLYEMSGKIPHYPEIILTSTLQEILTHGK